MKIRIRQVETAPGHRWQVSLDRQDIHFRSEPEARYFVRTLQRRLRAPQRNAG